LNIGLEYFGISGPVDKSQGNIYWLHWHLSPGNHESLGSGGSMVARLKLKGIDGRAPPGVEPAA